MPQLLHIKTFGCQMNVYDSDRMRARLVSQGLQWEPEIRKAEIILVNTCAIREKAEQKVLSLLGELKALKNKNPKLVLGVAGCVGQRMGRELLRKVPHLDLVMGPDQIDQVGELISAVQSGGERKVSNKLDASETRSYSQPAFVVSAKPSELLTIMKGCDHFCTYCVVPYVRGLERSRSIAEILEDVRRLVALGTKEIIFLGQNINTFGKETGECLAQLVEAANALPGLERIRYVTSHPKDLGQDLIEQFGRIEKLCPQLHLPFQAGNDRILRKMARGYTRTHYLEKIRALREACPGISLSTDVIVGFPSETEDEFAETVQMLEEVQFSMVYLFKYSERPGTKAAAYEDGVPSAVKHERFKRAEEVALRSIENSRKKLFGKNIPVLVDSMDKSGKYFSGRSLQYDTVHIRDAGPACIGKIVSVRIDEANRFHLKGKLCHFSPDNPVALSQTISKVDHPAEQEAYRPQYSHGLDRADSINTAS